VNYIQKSYLKYNRGNGFLNSLTDALHAAPPSADVFTDKIVEGIMIQTGCAGIISTVSRNLADLNRVPNNENSLAIQEYRQALNDILISHSLVDPWQQKIKQPFLHLSFHGMKDEHYGPYGIEVGTVFGLSCSTEVKKWFTKALAQKGANLLPDINLMIDQKFSGDESITFHRHGDGDQHQGYGANFHTFQIELSRTLRKEYIIQIIELFSELLREFQLTFIKD